MTTPLLIARLLLDAQDEFLRAAEHVPPPGRAGIGGLNTPAWVVAHAITTHDSWLTVFAQGGSFDACDAFCADWYQRQMAAGTDRPVHVDHGEALEAARRVFARTTKYLERCDAETLARRAHTEGTPWHDMGVTAGYMVARGVAHLFAHAGELSVIASLVRAGDLDMPYLRRVFDEPFDDAGVPLLTARLFLDARDELMRVAEALPVPARAGAFDRLNSGGFIVAHVADGQDRIWNAALQDLPRDEWLAHHATTETSTPDFDGALAALRRTMERSNGQIESVRNADLTRRFDVFGGERVLGPDLARETAHTWAHAGELQAIGSLAGMSDLGLPGTLRHCAGALTEG